MLNDGLPTDEHDLPQLGEGGGLLVLPAASLRYHVVQDPLVPGAD